jgi:lipid-binding SYLF domain-containing protein
MGTAGLGFGGQAGAEVTDFLIVLNSRAALVRPSSKMFDIIADVRMLRNHSWLLAP